MQIKRRFTTAGKSPYEKIPFRRATSEIKNPDGSIVFRLENFAVPEHWSQVAADILAQKYFRKAGVPARLKRVEETQVPSWLWRSCADERALAERPEHERYVGEADARQVFDRLAGTWTYWGWKGGYFSSRGRGCASRGMPAMAHSGRARTTPAPSSTSTATCWPCSSARRTARNGSTPACTGPTASTVPARATTTSTTSPAS